MKSDNEKNFPGQSKSASKKPYHSPTLSNFGTVALLTQATTMGIKDDGNPMGPKKIS